jgi:hypothetical protein
VIDYGLVDRGPILGRSARFYIQIGSGTRPVSYKLKALNLIREEMVETEHSFQSNIEMLRIRRL